MKNLRHLAIVAAALSLGCRCTPAPAPTPETQISQETGGRPALVMLIVVDQLRADLLDRYGDLFTGGFKRLRAQGHSYVNAAQDHAATETAVGHTTLGTGVYPSRHGIIANQWYEMAGGRWVLVSNVGDSTVKTVGASARFGASPVRDQRPTFAEWLMAASPSSKVASVSGKDRGAIQPVGHVHNAFVYYFDSPSSRFVTSTYYRNTDPSWVTKFNSRIGEHAVDTVWDLRVPKAQLSRADRDTVPTEGNGRDTFFPHKFSNEGTAGGFWQWWETTPQLDVATLDMAKTMVSSLDLGKDAAPDFLNISLSATDKVGHAYGPLSREQLDNLLRLDRELGDFFNYLDRTVGKNRWTVMLSADHGVLDSPEDIIARGEYAHRLTPAESHTLDSLRAHADSATDKAAAARELVASLKKLPIIADAWTHEDLEKASTDSFVVLQQRSMYPGREPDRFSRQGVEYRFIPGILAGARGSSHGQTYWYDRHVPMIFMGPGIPAGKDESRAATVDFAPTFAKILGIPAPKDLDGKVLAGVVTR